MSVVIVGNQVSVTLYDANGVEMSVANGVATPVNTRAVLVAGSDGTNTRFLKTAADGTLRVDPSGTTTQPVSGTVTANQGTAAALASAWPFKLTDGTNVMPTADVAARALFVKRTDGTNVAPTGDVAARKVFVQPTDGTNLQAMFDVLTRAGFVKLTDGTSTAAVKAASTAAAAVDPSAVVALSPNSPTPVAPDTVGAVGVLGALDNAASIVLAGQQSAGMLLAVGTLVGTIVPEISFDGGTTWVSTYFISADNTSIVMPTSIVFATSNTVTSKTILLRGGATHARVRVSAYTGGTANCTLRATHVEHTSKLMLGVDVNNVLRPVLVDSTGAVITTGASGSTAGFAYGEITTAAVTNVALRKTTYSEQAANAQRSVSSSSANDTSAGTGARTIRITFFTATFTGPFTEDITLNGTTAVATVATNICYIEKIEVLTVGSNNSNVGTISLFVNNSGGGGTIGTIAVGDNKTFWAHHYVPTGKTCSVTGLTGNNNNGSNQTVFMIKSKDLSVATSPEIQSSDTLVDGGGASQTQRTYATPIKITGPSRVTIFGAPAGTPTIINRAGFDFYEA